MRQWLKRAPKWAPTNEPETPYERARREWDARHGAAEVRARNWRVACLGLILLSLYLSRQVFYFADRVQVYPYVVEVASAGQVRAIGQLPQTPYEPTQELMSKMLGDWVQQVRGVSLDPVVERMKWWKVYYFVTPRAAQRLNAYVEDVNPMQQIGKITVVVEVGAVLPLSERAYQVHWEETLWDVLEQRERKTKYTGIFHTVIGQPSKDEKARRENPLGVYIAAFSWTKDLNVSQKE